MIKIGTVFSGIGAIEFALKRMKLEHEIVFACDNGNVPLEVDYDKEFLLVKQLKSSVEKSAYVKNLYKTKARRNNYVKQSFLANYQLDESAFFEDIKLFDGTDFFHKVDLLVGGSPCQSFSSVGKKAGFKDIRGTLFYEYARLINEIKPKVFIYENVRGVLTNNDGHTWDTMKNVFSELGYKIFPSTLNAHDYGIPQTRRRLFVVGFLNNKVDFLFPENTGCDSVMKDFLIDSTEFGGLISGEEGKIVFSKTPGIIDKKYYLSPKIKAYVLKGGTKTFYQKPITDLDIARPILSTMGNRHRAGIDNYITYPGGKIRMLSEREAHRMMGFTDDYKIVVSRAQAYKQAGNSIVVDVLINLVKQILATKETGL